MDDFLTSNEWQWRLARTVVQSVLGVLVANVNLIIGFAVLDPTMRALVVALVMAVLGEGGDGGPTIPRDDVRVA